MSKAYEWPGLLITPGPAMAILGLLLGNLILTLGDVAIKAIGSVSGLFQYLALRQIITLILVYPFWSQLPVSQRQPGVLGIHAMRGHLSLLGGICALYALLHLSLATANVIFYAAPLVTLLLARIWLKQVLTRIQITQVCLGFAGVLIALRPDDIHWAALSALVVAFTLALFNLLTCKMPEDQTMRGMVFWSNLTALPLTAMLAIIFWHPIQTDMLLLAFIVSLTTGFYQVIAARAYRSNDAGEIVIAEYSGLLFALLLGVWWFNEPAHWYTLLGILLIILPICWQSLRLWRQRNKPVI